MSHDHHKGDADAAHAAVYDEVRLDEMEWIEDDGMYVYECPCGDMFELTKADLDAGVRIARCPSCSLKVRVLLDGDVRSEIAAPDEGESQQQQQQAAASGG